MPQTSDPAVRRAVRQNAATLAMMGVTFVPIGRLRAQTAAPLEVESKPLGKPAKPVGHSGDGGDRRATAQRLLDELRDRYERDAPHKSFVTDHHNIVFGEGDPCARLMFVGEAPGAEEDRTGRPFVGKAGQLLDKMILAMGLSREQVYIANILKTRPPDNATPTAEECAACAPYLHDQIMIVRPEALVTLGLPASRTLLNSAESMGSLRARWHDFIPSPALVRSEAARGLPAGWAVPVMPTYHPAFLLRAYTDENRAKVWSDLRQVMERLSLRSGKKSATED